MARITKSVAERMLEDVPKEKRFWCQDGQEFKNMQELEAGLKRMSEETFCYHSNETKNDFSNWVRDVISDEKLAKDLLKSGTRDQAAKSVSARVTWLMGKLATG